VHFLLLLGGVLDDVAETVAGHDDDREGQTAEQGQTPGGEEGDEGGEEYVGGDEDEAAGVLAD
jgi:hypothetical protein